MIEMRKKESWNDLGYAEERVRSCWISQDSHSSSEYKDEHINTLEVKLHEKNLVIEMLLV